MLQLLRQRPFFLYMISHILSNVGLGIHLFTMSWLVLDLTESVSSLGWLLSLSTLPVILLSPFMGVFIDNGDRRLIVTTIQIAKGVLLLVIPLFFLSGEIPIAMLYVTSFLMAIADRIYFPASKGFMREMLAKEALLSANSLASVAMQLGMMGGSILAGFLLHVYGGPHTILINSILAFASGVSIFFARKGIVLPKARVGKSYESFTTELRDGICYVKENPSILKIAGLVALTEFTIQFYNILSVPFVRNELQMGPDVLGVLETFFAWGAILGGLTLARMVKWFGRKHFMSIGLLLMGIFFAAIPFIQGVFSGAILLLLFGTSLLQARTLYSTMIHEQVETYYQGRVNSLIYTLTSVIGFGMYAFIGYLGELVTASFLFRVIGLVIIIGAGVLFLISDRLMPGNKQGANVVTVIK
ncbi:MFS transporter [Brevibacillus migulae]|uniref:MFS transporter n=1 Tax=Brevibacillus migulae TaxID=1644114 RepID=UPI00106EE72C|nr:MFS transporter [Brevibacillus migulae]